MFRMPSVEAHATQGNCYCYCRWYCCSYMMCWAAQLAPDWGAPSCYFLSQPTSVVLWVEGGEQAQSLTSAKAARSPGAESVERREQMAFGLRAGGFLFPTAWVLRASAMPSLGKPAGPQHRRDSLKAPISKDRQQV